MTSSFPGSAASAIGDETTAEVEFWNRSGKPAATPPLGVKRCKKYPIATPSELAIEDDLGIEKDIEISHSLAAREMSPAEARPGRWRPTPGFVKHDPCTFVEIPAAAGSWLANSAPTPEKTAKLALALAPEA
jgi:hypothetical protein